VAGGAAGNSGPGLLPPQLTSLAHLELELCLEKGDRRIEDFHRQDIELIEGGIWLFRPKSKQTNKQINKIKTKSKKKKKKCPKQQQKKNPTKQTIKNNNNKTKPKTKQKKKKKK
jgi:hypothetical protein